MDSRDDLARAIDAALGRQGLGDRLVGQLRITARAFDKGDLLWSIGQEIASICCIREGWLTAVKPMADGSRHVLNFHVPYDIIGLEYLGRANATSDMVAHAPGNVLMVPIADFKRAVLSDASTSAAVMSLLSRRLGDVQNRLGVFAMGDANTKLVHLLHGLMVKQRRNGFAEPHIIRTPLTQSDIADALGLTNVTVNRTLSRLEEAGLIDFRPGAITLIDHAGLLDTTDGLVSTGGSTDTFG